jgi:signal transduction histidine kinase
VTSLPEPLQQYLNSIAVEKRSPAFLLVDGEGLLESLGGELHYYGLADLPCGEPVDDHVYFLTGLLPVGETPLLLSCLKMGSSRSVDIHAFQREGKTWVVLLDAAEQEANQAILQQKANELALLKEQQVRHIQKLKELNQQKNGYLGMAAHDLRNPICAVNIYTSFVLDDDEGNLTDNQRKLLSNIQQISDFMQKLLNNLLDVSQIESGKLELFRDYEDYAAFVSGSVDFNRIFFDKRNMPLRLDIEKDIPPVLIDHSKLEQVLNNLLGNAVKYCEEGTEVEVEVTREDSYIVTRVRDHGPGIPKDDIPQLFQAFQTAHVMPSEGERSTGLGLMIVRKIIEGHGGEIGLESEVGKGSVFHFTLPLD